MELQKLLNASIDTVMWKVPAIFTEVFKDESRWTADVSQTKPILFMMLISFVNKQFTLVKYWNKRHDINCMQT